MDIENQIEYWTKAAELDYPVIDHLFEKKDYVWSLYIGHLVIEKLLKAHYVNFNKTTPPKTHDLVKLFYKSNLPNDLAIIESLDLITEFNIEARYPEFKFNFYKKCDEKFTIESIAKIKEVAEWLKLMLK